MLNRTLNQMQDDKGRVVFTIPDPECEGLNLLTCQMPPDWRPTPLAMARVRDALLGAVEPHDLDRVPVSEVFHLAAHLTTDVLLKLAQAQAAVAKFQVEASEARQKLLANETQASLEREALVRAFFYFTQEDEAARDAPTEAIGSIVGRLTQRVYQVLDTMKPRPEVASKMVEAIKKVGAAWERT